MYNKMIEYLGKGAFFVVVSLVASYGNTKLSQYIQENHDHPGLDKTEIKKLGRYSVAAENIVESATPMRASGMLAELLNNLIEDHPQFIPILDGYIGKLRESAQEGYKGDRENLNEHVSQRTQQIITEFVTQKHESDVNED